MNGFVVLFNMFLCTLWEFNVFSLSHIEGKFILLIGQIKVRGGNVSSGIHSDYWFQLSKIGFTAISQTVLECNNLY